jgi:hypothetical protein
MKNQVDGLAPRPVDISKAVRGKYYDRMQHGTNIVLIAPDLLDTFPDSESVNEALRTLKNSPNAPLSQPNAPANPPPPYPNAIPTPKFPKRNAKPPHYKRITLPDPSKTQQNSHVKGYTLDFHPQP